MRLRLATARDLHRLTKITTTSLIDDPTYDYLNPHRKQFPEDNWTWMRARLESHLYNKRSTFILVEIDGDGTIPEHVSQQIETRPSNFPNEKHSSDGPCSTIISYAIWVRMGNDEAAKTRFAAKNTWLNMLDKTTHKLATWSLNHRFTRRDSSPARLEAVAAETDTVNRRFFSDSPDWWSLELMVTDRKFRRRGAGTKLVSWGTNVADQEGRFCGVEASPMGRKLYEACGFDRLAGWSVRVPGEKEVLEYDVMRRDAEIGEV